MARITVYQKPTCTTCRRVYKVLSESGVSFDAVDYFLKPISKTRLRELTAKMGIRPAELFRGKEETYKKLKLADRDISDAEALDLLAKYPELIERPIVEKGARAILARPAERIREIL